MNTLRSLVTFARAAADKPLSDLPALARTHIDTSNWRGELERAARQYKKTVIDRGDVHALYVLLGAMFAFNFVYSLPREMAHNAHAEKARFHVQ